MTIVFLLRFFAVALPAGLLPFVFLFIFCSKTKRATAFDFYGQVFVMWTKQILDCNSFASFHYSIPQYSKALRGYNLWNSMHFFILLSDVKERFSPSPVVDSLSYYSP